MASGISNLYCKFTLGMGVYGFTRGYRSENLYYKNFGFENNNNKRLTTEKISAGAVNTIIYLAPIFNLLQGYKLIKRMEISYRNKTKTDYPEAYEELVGYCPDTI